MNDELTLRKQMEIGAKAKALLDNEIFVKALADVRKAILGKWESCPIRDREGAHELKLMLKLLAEIESYIKQAITDGEFAVEELKRDKSIGQKIAERLRIA